MRQINRSVAEVVMGDQSQLLSTTEQRRFSGDILQAMGALTCLVAGQIYLRLFPGQDVVLGLIYLIGVLIVGVPVAVTAVRGFMQREFSAAMEILVTIAMLISVLTNEHVVAILIPLLLTIVHFFEEKSIMGGRDAIDGLKKMQSTSAVLLEDDSEREVDARELLVDDLIVVKPGMALPIDGVVVRGTSAMDQQSLTGEAMPKDVHPGDKVYAGTLNLEGALVVRVEKEFSDTSFQKIVKLLEETENSTVPAARITDRFMRYYIPIAIVAATLVWLFTRQIDRAVAILVVSCPCGHMLVSSAPMIAALSAATKRGILIKSASFIEKLTAVDKVFFDKTGTLTNGNLAVKECIPADGGTEEEVFSAALCVAVHSRHPLSRAIAEHSLEHAHEPDYEIKEQSGMGLRGRRGDSEILLGNEAFLRTSGVKIDEALFVDETSTYVARDGRVLGVLVYQDSMREDVPEMVEALQRVGIGEVGLLTGDKWEIARKLQQRSGLTSVHAQLLPEQKQAWIQQAREGHCVAFVGDGINDSLALSAADVGIAMGAMGVDTAIQSADIALMNTNLSNIPFLLDLARIAKRTIHQNLIIAFSTSLIMAALAALGIIGALPGALLHNAGAFLVLINSGKILRARSTEKPSNIALKRSNRSLFNRAPQAPSDTIEHVGN